MKIYSESYYFEFQHNSNDSEATNDSVPGIERTKTKLKFFAVKKAKMLGFFFFGLNVTPLLTSSRAAFFKGFDCMSEARDFMGTHQFNDNVGHLLLGCDQEPNTIFTDEIGNGPNMKDLSELNPGISNRIDDINCEGETSDIPPLEGNSTWHHQGWSGRQYKCHIREPSTVLF